MKILKEAISRHSRGFTTLEILIAGGLAMVVILAIAQLIQYTQKEARSLNSKIDFAQLYGELVRIREDRDRFGSDGKLVEGACTKVFKGKKVPDPAVGPEEISLSAPAPQIGKGLSVGNLTVLSLRFQKPQPSADPPVGNLQSYQLELYLEAEDNGAALKQNVLRKNARTIPVTVNVDLTTNLVASCAGYQSGGGGTATGGGVIDCASFGLEPDPQKPGKCVATLKIDGTYVKAAGSPNPTGPIGNSVPVMCNPGDLLMGGGARPVGGWTFIATIPMMGPDGSAQGIMCIGEKDRLGYCWANCVKSGKGGSTNASGDSTGGVTTGGGISDGGGITDGGGVTDGSINGGGIDGGDRSSGRYEY